jgi:16S rRNA C1402 (ribose-2'-O) methylase RsmI
MSFLSQFNKSSKIFAGIAAAVVIMLIALGFLLYQYVYIPYQVNQELNKTLGVLNQNDATGKQIFMEAAKKMQNISHLTLDELATNLEQINQSKATIVAYKNDTLAAKNNISSSSNKDVNEFNEVAKIQLDQRSIVSQSLINSLENQKCIVEKMNQYNSKASETQKAFERTQNNGDSAVFVESSKTIAEAMNTAAQSLRDLKICFQNDLAKYYTPELDKDIQSDTEVFVQTSNVLNKLAKAFENNNAQEIEAATQELQNLQANNQKPASPAFSKSGSLDKAVMGPTLEFQQAVSKLQIQSQTLQTLRKDLTNKYRTIL